MNKKSSQTQFRLRRWHKVLAVLFVVLVLELVLDVFEIAVGRVLLWTNPLRPKVGRLWVEDEKNQSGAKDVNALVQNNQDEPDIDQPIRDMTDLLDVLALRGNAEMNQEEFRRFYNNLPRRQAEKILNPFDFIQLANNPKWKTTQFSSDDSQLSIYFLDGYKNPLYESIIGLTDSLDPTQTVLLKDREEFNGRVVPSEVFYEAFNRLPLRYRQQIVNNPHRLVEWGSDLRHVGIAPTVKAAGVEIVFQVRENGEIQLYEMIASEIGVGYLIQEINRIDATLELKMPGKER